MKPLHLTAIAMALAASPVLAQETITESDLQAIDTNSDGIVTEAEYVAYMDLVFDALDTDGGGSISYAEIEVVLSEDERQNIDQNRDGRVTRAEFDAQMRRDFEAADRDGNGALN